MYVSERDIIAYSVEKHGTIMPKNTGETMVIYVEGMDAKLRLNEDAPDLWNDTRLLFRNDASGMPTLIGAWDATTEPGVAYTKSKQAKRLGGAARIAFGFHQAKWFVSYHGGNVKHRALKQCAPILCHRDFNADGKRTGDPQTLDVKGLNQHGTQHGVLPKTVGFWSAACLVGRSMIHHDIFINAIEQDPRYLQELETGNRWLVDTTVCAGDDLCKWVMAHRGIAA